MGKILPFDPQEAVDFEGTGRRRILMMSYRLLYVQAFLNSSSALIKTNRRIDLFRRNIKYAEALLNGMKAIEELRSILYEEISDFEFTQLTASNDDDSVDVDMELQRRRSVFYIKNFEFIENGKGR